ncbi:hypothetical protein B0H63DRAFT_286471 [Podospora didyma]|uniref:Uncharacterized protein n=1 Tax=Podospora didyma TaxID=330526 RepID=A0AAE0N5Y0_9PEZI|nr:hypothetical protein B0H63DRAFT_286471 [Podospora didyma]
MMHPSRIEGPSPPYGIVPNRLGACRRGPAAANHRTCFNLGPSSFSGCAGVYFDVVLVTGTRGQLFRYRVGRSAAQCRRVDAIAALHWETTGKGVTQGKKNIFQQEAQLQKCAAKACASLRRCLTNFSWPSRRHLLARHSGKLSSGVGTVPFPPQVAYVSYFLPKLSACRCLPWFFSGAQRLTKKIHHSTARAAVDLCGVDLTKTTSARLRGHLSGSFFVFSALFPIPSCWVSHFG